MKPIIVLPKVDTIMKGFYSAVAVGLVCLPLETAGFAPTHSVTVRTTRRGELPYINNIAIASFNDISSPRVKPVHTVKAKKFGADDSTSDSPTININLPYALAYILFLAFAYMKQAGETERASMEILQQYIANPLNPGFNELFITVFNLLGLYAAPLACLLMPGARGQKLPATPFLLGSMFGGYGVLGMYTSTRKQNPSPVTKSKLGWFTANVLENKVFNYFILALVSSAYITSGAAAAFISNPGELIQGYMDLFAEGSAIVSASSLDFVILTLSAASFIPEDLSRRGYKGDLAPELIALLTLLLPGVGVALYCALRPSLDEE